MQFTDYNPFIPCTVNDELRQLEVSFMHYFTLRVLFNAKTTLICAAAGEKNQMECRQMDAFQFYIKIL